MPDKFGVCHCGGTGADGCEPRLSPEQIRYQRRNAILGELDASDAPALAPPPELKPSSLVGTTRAALAAPGRNLLLDVPVAHPLLAQVAGREPFLTEALRLDHPVPANPEEIPDVQ